LKRPLSKNSREPQDLSARGGKELGDHFGGAFKKRKVKKSWGGDSRKDSIRNARLRGSAVGSLEKGGFQTAIKKMSRRGEDRRDRNWPRESVIKTGARGGVETTGSSPSRPLGKTKSRSDHPSKSHNAGTHAGNFNVEAKQEKGLEIAFRRGRAVEANTLLRDSPGLGINCCSRYTGGENASPGGGRENVLR